MSEFLPGMPTPESAPLNGQAEAFKAAVTELYERFLQSYEPSQAVQYSFDVYRDPTGNPDKNPHEVWLRLATSDFPLQPFAGAAPIGNDDPQRLFGSVQLPELGQEEAAARHWEAVAEEVPFPGPMRLKLRSYTGRYAVMYTVAGPDVVRREYELQPPPTTLPGSHMPEQAVTKDTALTPDEARELVDWLRRAAFEPRDTRLDDGIAETAQRFLKAASQPPEENGEPNG